ncbi:MAG: hypothetical protein ACRDI2_02125, partial [Chloroflexota bacterium]
AVVSLLVAVMLPQLLNIWAVVSSRGGRAPQTAAQPSSPATSQPAGAPTEVVTEPPLVEPLVTVAPPTPLPPTPTDAPTAAPPTATARPQRSTNARSAQAGSAPAGRPPAASPTAAPPRTTARAGAGQTADTPAAGRSVQTTPSAPSGQVAAASPTQPAPTSAAQPTRVVTGQISAVDRKQRLFNVFSAGGADGPARTWQVRLRDATEISQPDGGKLSFEEVGLADQVEVAGAEVPEAPGTLSAATVRVLVSAVAARPTRVLVLLDGVESLRAPEYGHTGDWIKRLNDTGYAVTPLEPDRISSGSVNLKDFRLIVIGYPATLSASALQAVKASNVPVLNAEPRLVQALGLGLNVDPAQPARSVSGKSVDIAGQASPVTQGFSGDTVLAHNSLYRMPIVASGAVLGWVWENGQKRAIWSVTDNRMYFGFWFSAGGQNHNAAYWALFDRSVLWLLGRDPLTVSVPASAASAAPTATTGKQPTPTSGR